MATWTNIEILGAAALDQEQSRMSYIQRLLSWVRIRVQRILGKAAVEQKKPDGEYLYDVHDVDLPVRI